jgi:hypothetical protein
MTPLSYTQLEADVRERRQGLELNMNGSVHTANQGASNGCADLLGLGMDLDFVSPERRNLMAAPENTQYSNGAMSLVDDVPMEMEVDAREREPTARQERPNSASRMEADVQAPGRHLEFDSRVPRHIRAPYSRRNHNGGNRSHQQGDFYAPTYTVYHDPEDARGRAYRHDRQFREASPETLRSRAEASIVAGMADMDVKQERDDRRDGDRYRGGGNKRRRDGKLEKQRWMPSRDSQA